MSKVYVVVEIYGDYSWDNDVEAVYPSTILLKTAKRRVEALGKRNFYPVNKIGAWKWTKTIDKDIWCYCHEYYGHYYGYTLTLMEVTQ